MNQLYDIILSKLSKKSPRDENIKHLKMNYEDPDLKRFLYLMFNMDILIYVKKFPNVNLKKDTNFSLSILDVMDLIEEHQHTNKTEFIKGLTDIYPYLNSLDEQLCNILFSRSLKLNIGPKTINTIWKALIPIGKNVCPSNEFRYPCYYFKIKGKLLEIHITKYDVMCYTIDSNRTVELSQKHIEDLYNFYLYINKGITLIVSIEDDIINVVDVLFSYEYECNNTSQVYINRRNSIRSFIKHETPLYIEHNVTFLNKAVKDMDFNYFIEDNSNISYFKL